MKSIWHQWVWFRTAFWLIFWMTFGIIWGGLIAIWRWLCVCDVPRFAFLGMCLLYLGVCVFLGIATKRVDGVIERIDRSIGRIERSAPFKAGDSLPKGDYGWLLPSTGPGKGQGLYQVYKRQIINGDTAYVLLSKLQWMDPLPGWQRLEPWQQIDTTERR